MPSEFCSDERPSNALRRFRIGTFNRILDKIVQSTESRFSNTFSICRDLAVLNPKNFNEIKDELPKDSLKILFKKLQKYNENVYYESLQEELLNFISNWDGLKTKVLDAYQTSTTHNINLENFDSEDKFGTSNDEC